MENILRYQQFLNEMWDTIPDIKVINKIPARDEDMTYEFEIDGDVYKVFILVRRWEDNTVTLEIHFSSKADPSDTEYSDSLTGRNNMQDVMGSVWWAVKEWAKERSKGGNLISIIVVAKSESLGDESILVLSEFPFLRISPNALRLSTRSISNFIWIIYPITKILNFPFLKFRFVRFKN
jgi:hypothetical protein